MTICEQIEKIKEQICDDYCKYPEQYQKRQLEDINEMVNKICKNCPLLKL